MSKRYKALRRLRYHNNPDRLGNVIGNIVPGDDWECQCARCGSSIQFDPCASCGGDGWTEPGELYEQDPLWYDQNDTEACPDCDGEGSFAICISSRRWCQTHASVGRGKYPRHTVEWFHVGYPETSDTISIGGVPRCAHCGPALNPQLSTLNPSQ
jgi:hypothetical protein